ncbi:MAG TPA: hypothetical protein VJU59_01270 [Paraburkholderia sp.]|uniref:hypothetical protein n=1 Tax=Paraburkholderia sp. TaxID=1926495 RepID=UPI002B462548|nr:hypothetical protein [Paraburkholderia sp.]HKR38300.1 hypothetical protein [Paraburkholderia sp.]
MVVSMRARGKVRAIPDVGKCELDHDRHRIDDGADYRVIQVQDDHGGLLVERSVTQPKANAQIEDRNDPAMQVDDSAEMLRGVRNPRDGDVATADFPNVQYVDCILVGAKRESEVPALLGPQGLVVVRSWLASPRPSERLPVRLCHGSR